MATCDAETMLADAVEAGFCEITGVPAEMVELYELREAAGSALTPQELVTAATCNISAVGTLFGGVKQYLLCLLAA